jgi:hypothetical protein
LEREGKPVDASTWEDPARFSDLVQKVFTQAGCPLPASLNGQALTSATPRSFCGPGQGEARLNRPRVDSCLNMACRYHDACYAMCDQKLPWGCQWSSTTAGCDDPFVAAAKDCELIDHPFASRVVIAVATFLNSLPKTGCRAANCPDFAQAGPGPCKANLEEDVCRSCLAAVDNDNCAGLCSADPEPAFCTAAVCESTAQCFGGYGYGAAVAAVEPTGEDPVDAGTGDAGPAGPFPLPAADALWNLILVDVKLPLLKATSEEWDVGEDDGFGPPDVRVVITGNELNGSFPSSIADDVFEAQWNEPLLFGRTASMATVAGRVVDVDLVFDDIVGDCRLPSDVLARFGVGPFSMVCDAPGLTVRLEFTATSF